MEHQDLESMRWGSDQIICDFVVFDMLEEFSFYSRS
jgi:hypothetical protein